MLTGMPCYGKTRRPCKDWGLSGKGGKAGQETDRSRGQGE